MPDTQSVDSLLSLLGSADQSKIGDVAAKQPIDPNTGKPTPLTAEQLSGMIVKLPYGGYTVNVPGSSGGTSGGGSTVDKGLADLNAMNAGIGTLTAAQEEGINNQAQMAGGVYDPLIASAQEAKRQGMPVATVRAGQKGGFENTQVAGVAALTPTEGANWVGAGGSLEKTQSAYDQQISNLKLKKEQAIAEAKISLREAKITGQEKDFARAKQLYDLAKGAEKEALDIVAKKQDMAIKNQNQLDKEEDRTLENIAPNLSYNMTGNTEADLKTIQNEAKLYNVDPNRLLAKINEFSSTNSKDNLAKLQTKLNIAKDIPKGETYYDKDTGFTIIGSKDPERLDVIQTTPGGMEYKVLFDMTDPANPKELTRIKLGPRWKAGGTGKETGKDADHLINDVVLNLKSQYDSGSLNPTMIAFSVASLGKELKYDDQTDLMDKLDVEVNNRLNALLGINTPAETEVKAPAYVPADRNVYNLYGLLNPKDPNAPALKPQGTSSSASTPSYFSQNPLDSGNSLPNITPMAKK